MQFTVVGFVLLAFVVFTSLKNYFFSDRIPGPLAGRLTKFYRIWLCLGGDGPLRYYDLSRQYGAVVRTGPNHISLFDSELIPVVYDFRNKFKKTSFYQIFRPMYKGIPMDTIFTVYDPLKQRPLKRILVAHMTSVPTNFTDPIKSSVAILLGKMHQSKGQPIDLWQWACFWAFDLSHHIVFGEACGYLNTGSDFNGMLASLFHIIKGASVLGQVPEYGCPLLGSQRVTNFFQMFQRHGHPVETAMKIFDERLQLHQTTAHECGNAFMCKLLKERNVNDHAERKEITNLLFEAFFAPGMELAVSLNSIIYSLTTNPRTYDKLCKLLRHEKIGNDGDLTGADDLYLTAIIKESLRLYAPNPMPMERLAPAEFQVDGHHIPENTVVSIHPHAAHRDPIVYGDDVESFRPERWLEVDAARAKLMERNYLVFGKGNRACSGRELAMLQLRTAVRAILETFDVSLACNPSNVRLKMYWVTEFAGLKVAFTPLGKTL